MRLFLSGITDEMLQARRERLLDVSAAQVQEVADKFLVQRAGEANLAVLGEKKDWVDAAQGWELRDLGMAEKTEEAAAAAQGGAPEAAAAAA
jgi:Zn-dependent M16 (insulinase) family peptidase